MLVIPLARTNTQRDAVSEIDNRALADSPIKLIGTSEFSSGLDAYLNDRIGFRSDYINWYEKAHDKILDMLIHPFYIYGKDKEVFATFDLLYFDDEKYIIDFADFVKGMQDYCESEDMQFVFQWEPDKSAIKTALLPDGLYYDDSWVDALFTELNEREINYVDNITLLKELNDEGISVYNHKYDAGHFNDNGAFYSVNNVLDNLYRGNSAIHVNEESEIEFGTTIADRLTQSDFVINEEIPSNTIKNQDSIEQSEDFVDSLYIAPSTRNHLFAYYTNTEREKEGAPKVLVFGGSHMGMEWKYYANSFSEYLNVPNYTNVINYEYYIEKFKPDVVVFEICQRTFRENSFPIHDKDTLRANIDAYEGEQ